MEKIEAGCYCRCGAMLKFRMRGSDVRVIADELAAAFWAQHTDTGCGRATQQQAAAARRAQDVP